MVIYNLEETPNVFITPNYYDNVFEYRMEEFKGEEDGKTIGYINLRSDKLMVYGSEVKESVLQRFYESLVLRPKVGIIYVNCNGACYVRVAGRTYRPIHNVIFDWSSFGVVVPNSLNESLKKQVEELEKAVKKSNKEGELARIEVECTKASLKASNDEVNELKKVQNELGLKVQKAYEKVALVDFELELYKIELESCKKELDDVLDDLCSCKDERAKMEVELHTIRDQLSSEILNSNKINDDLEMKSKFLENELTLVRYELHSTKDKLEFSDKNVKALKEQLSSFKNICKDMKEELEKVQDQHYMANKEVQNTKTLLESSRKEVDELKDRIRRHEEEHQCMELQIQKMINHTKLINLEMKSNNKKLDQLLISSLWKKLNHKVSLPSTNCGHIVFQSSKEFDISPPNLEIIAHEIPIC
ncbi:hypothetical protein RND81_09G098800 [Saponaria officinalis]|uniref:Uncharacterized protein n=1 Tax=Saponaria officinalis TaxID=3572 RepID=A0AAW1IIV7_SAPOF